MPTCRHWIVCSLLLILPLVVAQAEPATLTGRVVGRDDAAVAGARVTIVVYGAAPGQQRLFEARSDEAAGFSVSVGMQRGGEAYLAIATMEGYALGWGYAKPAEPLTIRLVQEPVRRSGLVETPEGQPIAGARVSLAQIRSADWHSNLSIPTWAGEEWVKTTDAQGRFSFEGIPAKMTMFVTAAAPGRGAIGDGFVGDSVPALVLLPPEAVVVGRVTRDGDPMPGISVSAYPRSRFPLRQQPVTALTAADGSYELRGLPPGWAGVNLTLPEGLTATVPQPLNLAPGDRATANLAVMRGGVIRGKVTAADSGQPIPGANVQVQSDESAVRPASTQTRTTDMGIYELRLPPGTYRLSCYASGWSRSSRQPTPVTVADGAAVEVDLTMTPPHKIAGTIVLPDGRPALDATVWFVGFGRAEAPKTKGDGSFELLSRDPPSSGPSAVVGQDEKRDLMALTVLGASENVVRIQLQPAAYVHGKVVDEQDRPLAGFPVTCELHIGSMTSASSYFPDARTDADGNYRLGPFPANCGFSIHAGLGNSAIISQEWQKPEPFTLQPGKQRELPVLKVDPKGRTVRFFVGDAEQRPIAGATVLAPGAPEPAYSDEKGQGELVRLPREGKVAIVAMHPSLPQYAAAVVSPGSDYWPGLLLKPLGSATGRIADATGKPRAGVTLSVLPRLDGHYSSIRSEDLPARLPLRFDDPQVLTTDAEGRWRCDSLIADMEYSVMVWTEYTQNRRSSSGVGTFKAEGNGGVQDVGDMKYTPPPPW